MHKILVIEDGRTERRILAQLLSNIPAQTSTAADRDEAEKLLERRYSAIVFDMSVGGDLAPIGWIDLIRERSQGAILVGYATSPSEEALAHMRAHSIEYIKKGQDQALFESLQSRLGQSPMMKSVFDLSQTSVKTPMVMALAVIGSVVGYAVSGTILYKDLDFRLGRVEEKISDLGAEVKAGQSVASRLSKIEAVQDAIRSDTARIQRAIERMDQ